MKTLIVTGGSLDISWAKDFVRTINAEYIIAADSGLKYIDELGLVPDAEAYKAEYYKYIMNGLMTQLVRIEQGKNVEEAHMRNRQLIAKWVYEKGKADNVIELKQRDGKTYVVVNDYAKLRELFGTLLAEVQRIKSDGVFSAG